MTTKPRDRLGASKASVPDLDEAIRAQRDSLKGVLHTYGSNAGPNGLHDLRVSLRRTAAVGSLFRGFPEPKSGRTVRRPADRLRRELSAARQRQVSLELIRILTRKDEATFRLVAPHLCSARGVYRPPGIADVQRTGAEVLLAMDGWRESLRESRHDKETDRELARRIRRRIRKGATDILAFGVPDVKTLHPLRIACKRLRYELEILRDVVPGVERMVKVSRRVQETLGDANDWACVIHDLTETAQSLRPGEGKVVRGLIAKAKALRRRTFLRAQEAAADFMPVIETLMSL